MVALGIEIEDEVQISTNFLFTIPVLLVGIAICTLEPLDHGRASTLGAGRVAIKYLFGAQYVVMAFLVAKAFVGDASKIFKAYRDEIERHFDNPQVLHLVVEKKNSTDHSARSSRGNGRTAWRSGYTARPSTKLLPRKLSPGLPP